jgi:hypothetical protein
MFNSGKPADDRTRKAATHFEPVKFGVVVGLGETREHEVVGILEEGLGVAVVVVRLP